VTHLSATFGVIIALEGMGLPLPRESVLVLAALYAARMATALLAIVAPAAGAIAARASNSRPSIGQRRPQPMTGPIPVNAPPGDPSHDYPQLATQVDIASQGYVEEEYFRAPSIACG
jgi:hypothetical protein